MGLIEVLFESLGALGLLRKLTELPGLVGAV
jgi:hypothetical protein